MAVVARVVRCWLSPGATYHSLPLANSNSCRDKWEEGGDDVKSAWYMSELHTCYNPRYKEQAGDGEQISKSR